MSKYFINVDNGHQRLNHGEICHGGVDCDSCRGEGIGPLKLNFTKFGNTNAPPFTEERRRLVFHSELGKLSLE